MTPAKQLEAIGRALHGQAWIGPTADDVGVNRETIRRWLSGRTPLERTHGVFLDLLAILQKRESEMIAVRQDLERWLLK